jgi:hypothetical protein
LLAYALTAALPGEASAQGAAANDHSNWLLRLYVNAYSQGSTDKTPQDPNGNSNSKPFGNDGASLELILYRHVGLAVSQDYESRNYDDPSGNTIHERWVSTYYSLTGYAFDPGPGWNLFGGASTGTIDRYTAEVNGVQSAPTNPAHDLPLTRYYAGIDLAFKRIGFRFSYIQSQASKTISGQQLALNQTLDVLSVFIPFN